MKAKVYSIDGKPLKEIELPEPFSEEFRDDLIKRAVISDETKELQPKGNYKLAGLETSARYRGRKEDYGSLKNRGQAMLPREVKPEGGWGQVKRIPSAVKGRRAHPPKPEKILAEEMNKKEYAKALRSALAATLSKEIVERRHNLKLNGIELPIILEKRFEEIKKTREVADVLKALKVYKLVEKAKEKAKRKTGTGRHKKTKKKGPKGPLLVISSKGELRGGRNLPGVDVVKVKDLKVKYLAPGTHPGRLTIFTESALEEISKVWGA